MSNNINSRLYKCERYQVEFGVDEPPSEYLILTDGLIVTKKLENLVEISGILSTWYVCSIKIRAKDSVKSGIRGLLAMCEL